MPVEVHQGDVVTVVAQTAEHARQQRAAAAEDQQWRLRFGAPGDPLTQFGGQADDVFACQDARFVVTDRVAQAAAGVTEVDQRGPVADPGVPERVGCQFRAARLGDAVDRDAEALPGARRCRHVGDGTVVVVTCQILLVVTMIRI